MVCTCIYVLYILSLLLCAFMNTWSAERILLLDMMSFLSTLRPHPSHNVFSWSSNLDLAYILVASKAFDRVDYGLLFQTLEKMGPSTSEHKLPFILVLHTKDERSMKPRLSVRYFPCQMVFISVVFCLLLCLLSWWFIGWVASFCCWLLLVLDVCRCILFCWW